MSFKLAGLHPGTSMRRYAPTASAHAPNTSRDATDWMAPRDPASLRKLARQEHAPVLCGPDPLGRSVCALQEQAGAASVPQSIERVLTLHHRQQRGGKVVRTDMLRFTQVSHDNDVTLYLDRQYIDEGLLPALRQAKKSIHIAMLTFDSDRLGSSIADLLIAKKKADPTLQVRIIVDNFGSNVLWRWTREGENLRRMRGAGIEVVINDIVTHGLEHRKLVVVDGEQAFVGGTCIGQPYYESKAHRLACKAAPDAALVPPDLDMPEYHDYGMRLVGTSAHYLQAAFMQSWLLHGKGFEPTLSDADLTARYFPPLSAPPPGATHRTSVKVVNGVPWTAESMGPSLFEVVNAAKKTLDMTFAYVLVPAFVDALVAAANRGVKVRLIVPGHQGIDIKPTWYAFREQYRQLFATRNVEIYEFNQYTHVKLMVADRRLVFASTGNPEWNSWQRAFDETILFDSPALAAEVERRVFDPDMSPAWSQRITPEGYAQMTLRDRVVMFLSRCVLSLFFRVRLSPTPHSGPMPGPQAPQPASPGR